MKKLFAVLTVIVVTIALCVGSFAAASLDRIHIDNNVLDASDDVKGDNPIQINPGQKVYILGWAAKAGTNLDYVYWTCDGEAKECDGTDSYLPRTDVAGAIGLNPDYAQRSSIGANGAMMELLGADELANGKYAIKIMAKYQDSSEELIVEKNLQVGEAAEKNYVLIAGAGSPHVWLTNDGESVGVKFTTTIPFSAISIPNTWASRQDANRSAHVVLNLYKFAFNIENSMSKAPVKTTEYDTIADGVPACALEFGEALAAGTYIFEIKTVGEQHTGDSSTGAYFVLDKAANDVDSDYFEYFGTPKQFSLSIYGENVQGEVVATNPEDTDAPTAPVYKNASFDSIYVDGALNFGQPDGSASDKLDGVNRTVGNGDGSISEIRLRGWIGFEQEIEMFGYKIGNAEPVFDASFTEATEQPVKDAGGENALRFNVTVPVAGIEGEQKIVMVVKLATGDIVEIDDTLVATGPATAPNTSFTFVGTPAQNPPTADASMVIFVIAAAAIALVVLKKKVF